MSLQPYILLLYPSKSIANLYIQCTFCSSCLTILLKRKKKYRNEKI